MELTIKNILGTLQLTRIVLPRLIAHSNASKGSRKAKSLILNIGSLSGRIPSALLATYSCTKGGLQTWNRALAMEVKAKGVVVQMVLPAFVVSQLPSRFVHSRSNHTGGCCIALRGWKSLDHVACLERLIASYLEEA